MLMNFEIANHIMDKRSRFPNSIPPSIIDDYLRYFHSQLEESNAANTYIFATSFYQQLVNCDFEALGRKSRDNGYFRKVKRCLIEANIFDKDNVFMPICDEGHWCLAAIINLKNWLSSSERPTFITLIIFDSLASRMVDRDALENMLRNLIKFANECTYQEKRNFGRMKVVWPSIPQQKSTDSSGIYMLQCINSFFSDPIDFKKKDGNLKNWFSRAELKVLENILQIPYTGSGDLIPQYTFKKDERQTDVEENGRLVPDSLITCKICGDLNKHGCENCEKINSVSNTVCHSNRKRCTTESSRVFNIKQKRSEITPLQNNKSSLTEEAESQQSYSSETCSRITTRKKNAGKETFVIPDVEDLESERSASTGDLMQPHSTLFTFPTKTSLTSLGSVPIHLSDYDCLGPNELLNDAIIEFYLRYLHLRQISETDRRRTFIFSTYFYESLTKSTSFGDDKLNAENMYNNVKNWNKNVDIFEKDFLLVPVNSNFHWLLAIICFPSLRSCVTMSDEKPASEESEEPIRQPCILILDSNDSEWKREVAENLLIYLKMEYQHKKQKKKSFNNVKIIMPQVPMQHNTVDCGIFVLQYAESFFQTPIKDFRSSLSLKNWFSHKEIKIKRYCIAKLIRQIMKENNIPLTCLPQLHFDEDLNDNAEYVKTKDQASAITSVENLSISAENSIRSISGNTGGQKNRTAVIELKSDVMKKKKSEPTILPFVKQTVCDTAVTTRKKFNDSYNSNLSSESDEMKMSIKATKDPEVKPFEIRQKLRALLCKSEEQTLAELNKTKNNVKHKQESVESQTSLLSLSKNVIRSTRNKTYDSSSISSDKPRQADTQESSQEIDSFCVNFNISSSNFQAKNKRPRKPLDINLTEDMLKKDEHSKLQPVVVLQDIENEKFKLWYKKMIRMTRESSDDSGIDEKVSTLQLKEIKSKKNMIFAEKDAESSCSSNVNIELQRNFEKTGVLKNRESMESSDSSDSTFAVFENSKKIKGFVSKESELIESSDSSDSTSAVLENSKKIKGFMSKESELIKSSDSSESNSAVFKNSKKIKGFVSKESLPVESSNSSDINKRVLRNSKKMKCVETKNNKSNKRIKRS